jgi:hypothetical protein
MAEGYILADYSAAGILGYILAESEGAQWGHDAVAGAHGSHDVEEVESNPEVEGNLEVEDILVGDNLEVEFQADMMVAEDSPSQGEANQTRESCTFDRSVWIHSK